MLVDEEFGLVEDRRRWLLVGFVGEVVELGQRGEMVLCFHHRIGIDEASCVVKVWEEFVIGSC